MATASLLRYASKYRKKYQKLLMGEHCSEAAVKSNSNLRPADLAANGQISNDSSTGEGSCVGADKVRGVILPQTVISIDIVGHSGLTIQ